MNEEAVRNRVTEIMKRSKDEARKVLTEYEAKQILSLYQIPVTKEKLVTSPEEAVAFFHTLHAPVVMKIVSPDIIHKSEANCVKPNLRSEEEVRKAFEEIIKNARTYDQSSAIHGVLAQEMVENGIEVIIGAFLDDTFGPVLMFGLGGIFVEILRDVTFRAIPITKADAEEMVQDIKGYAILKGTRGKKGVNMEELYATLLNASTFMREIEEINELDINPLFVHEKGVIAADARIIVK